MWTKSLTLSNYNTFDSYSYFFEALLPDLTVKKLKRVSNKAKLALSQE